MSGHTDSISSVAFSPDGRYLLAGSHDGTARQWDSRAEIKPLTLAGCSSGLWTAAYSPDGLLLATAGRDNVVTLWDLTTRQPARSLTGHEHWVASVALRRMADPSRPRAGTARPDCGTRAPARCSARSPAGRRHDGCLFSRWPAARHARQGQECQGLGDRHRGRAPFILAERAPGRLARLFSDSRYVVTGWNAAAQIWDVAASQPSKVIGPHTNEFELRAVAYSPDARVVLTGSGDGTVKLWNANSGAALRTLNAHADAIDSAIFSPDGRFILTSSSDRTAKLWNAATAAEVRTFAGHTGAVNAAVFSPDGKFITTASDDGTARLWNVESGATPSRHSSRSPITRGP